MCTKLLILFTTIVITGCTPTVKVEAPDKPIDVNMNVNIKHKIKVTKKDPNKKKEAGDAQENKAIEH